MTSRAIKGVVLLSCLVWGSAAWCQQEPASEGRLITPAGTLVIDAGTHMPAVGAMPMAMLRSPDAQGQGSKGRYLLVVNSGYGVQFSEDTNDAQQSIAVIDLNASPEPRVIQNIYFPSPQSANVGLAFSSSAGADGKFEMYVSGGFENKVWIFQFDPKAAAPVQPASPGPSTKVPAPSFDISKPGEVSPKDYNDGKAALYPTGLALTADGTTLVTANNLGDSVTIVHDLRGTRRMERVDLHHPGKPAENIYPYGVVVLGTGKNARAYISCWNDSSVAVVSLGGQGVVRSYIGVDRHPTAMILNADGSRLFVANSNADNVSVIDTTTDQEIERIDVRLAEDALPGASPEGVALSDDEKVLYVANAHSNAVAVVELSEATPCSVTITPASARARVAGPLRVATMRLAVPAVEGSAITGSPPGDRAAPRRKSAAPPNGPDVPARGGLEVGLAGQVDLGGGVDGHQGLLRPGTAWSRVDHGRPAAGWPRRRRPGPSVLQAISSKPVTAQAPSLSRALR